MNVTPVLLIILDGFGYRPDGEDNAILKARKPNWDRLWNTYPHTTIQTSEAAVACPPARWATPKWGTSISAPAG